MAVADGRASRWFVLLASPGAARSAWVDREVAWRLANKPAGRLLVVATAPLRWDEAAGDWAADAPVPPSLRGALRAEPLWVDLTRLRPSADGPAAPVPSEDLATIAAPLRGVDRDTLIGPAARDPAVRLTRNHGPFGKRGLDGVWLPGDVVTVTPGPECNRGDVSHI